MEHCKGCRCNPQDSPQLLNHNGPREVDVVGEQMDIEQMSSLDWVHGRDMMYYHRNCAGTMTVVPTAVISECLTSLCDLCGMCISSTLSHPSVTYPENRARLA